MSYAADKLENVGGEMCRWGDADFLTNSSIVTAFICVLQLLIGSRLFTVGWIPADIWLHTFGLTN